MECMGGVGVLEKTLLTTESVVSYTYFCTKAYTLPVGKSKFRQTDREQGPLAGSPRQRTGIERHPQTVLKKALSLHSLER
jgi:hypothetical protein